jgi:hypothetical protein
VERVRIDPSGFVGIGTTSPSCHLDVRGDIVASNLFTQTTGAARGYLKTVDVSGTFITSVGQSNNTTKKGAYLRFDQRDASAYQNVADNSLFNWGVTSSNVGAESWVMALDSSGNLSVRSTVSTRWANINNMGCNATDAQISIQTNANSRFWISQPAASNILCIGGTGGSAPSIGVINVDPNTGRVGINTGAPAYGLQVNSGGSTTNAAICIDNITNASTGFGAQLLLANTTPGGGRSFLGAISAFRENTAADYNASMVFSIGSNTSLVEAMRINSSGSVCIGSNPSPALNTPFTVIGTPTQQGALPLSAFYNPTATNFGVFVGRSGVNFECATISFQYFGANSNTNNVYIGVFGGPALRINYLGNVTVPGSLSKGSGTFDIAHPTLSNTRLVHSFIEGPRCDLIYRGNVRLASGQAMVNIDSDCVSAPECAMTQGTFVALCKSSDVFVQNNETFDRVIGSVSNNILKITSENSNSSAQVSWMVVAERNDKFIRNWDRTNSEGSLITQYPAPESN